MILCVMYRLISLIKMLYSVRVSLSRPKLHLGSVTWIYNIVCLVLIHDIIIEKNLISNLREEIQNWDPYYQPTYQPVHMKVKLSRGVG